MPQWAIVIGLAVAKMAPILQKAKGGRHRHDVSHGSQPRSSELESSLGSLQLNTEGFDSFLGDKYQLPGGVLRGTGRLLPLTPTSSLLSFTF